MLFFKITFFSLGLFVTGYLAWQFQTWYHNTNFAKNFKAYGFEVFKYYFQKVIVVPWQLRYSGNDEFHQKLELNVDAMLVMTDKEREQYQHDLTETRNKVGKHNFTDVFPNDPADNTKAL